MSDHKCKKCHCDSHCGKECTTCRNDVCQKCECEKCKDQSEWAWQDSGIEQGI
jgi:hypothetical protein